MVVKKVLLINPPGKCYLKKDGSLGERKHCTPPLGIAYLAANLLRNSYEVEVLDILAEGYHNEQFKDPFIIYGLDLDVVIERVKRAKPDLIGLSLLFSNRVNESYEIIRAIKQELPGVPIVIGGQHPTGVPLEMMKNPDIDFLLLGEADTSLVCLADSLNGRLSIGRVPGLYYREGSQVKNTTAHLKPTVAGEGWQYFSFKDSPSPKKLSALPLPAWHLFPMQAYWHSEVRVGGGDIVKEKFAVMVTSRGCPWSCYFCASSLMAGYKAYRTRPIDDLVREIRWLIDTYKVEEVQFLDDNFFVNKQRAKDLFRVLAQDFPDTVFSVPSGTEINRLDCEMIDLMAAANVHKVTIAVESGDQGIQNALIEKRVELKRLPELVKYIRGKGMECRALFMIGFPGETRKQIMRTVDLALNLDSDDFYISVVTPLPGTLLYDQCLKEGLFYEDFDINNLRYSVANIKLPDTNREELEILRREVWLEYQNIRRSKQDSSAKDVFRTFKDSGEYENAGFKSILPKSFRKGS